MDDLQIVSDSFDRSMKDPHFFDKFYTLFLSKSPEIAALFANTDFVKQQQLLKATVALMVRKAAGHGDTSRVVTRIAESHGKHGYQIAEHLYALWLDSLCETVVKSDPQYSPSIGESWRRHMQAGIDMILRESA
jgi:hemoglobin-like flavoprotein